MANENRGNRFLNFVQKNYTGVGVVLVIVFMMIPVPKVLVDLFMVLNLSASILVLLSVISIPRASDFDTFPRIILILTMFGLGINVSSTRLILAGKISGSGSRIVLASQSNMVQAFANIVTGDNIVVGFVIFIILIIVQVLVVTKGATRIAEVAARFSLDSMSQKFFDVDNRLNSGAIDDVEAGRLKDAIRKEIDFYSTMDGASKFVSGNVKAGIVITVVNLIGGFIMGMVYNHLDFSTALRAYSRLTIGDGLLSQLPSMMVSFATGLLVTGTKSDEDFGEDLKNNFTRDGYIYVVLGAFLAVMGLALGRGTPSLLLLLVVIGIGFVAIGFKLTNNRQKAEAAAKEAEAKAKSSKQVGGSPDDQTIAMIDPLSLELGYALIPLVDNQKGAELLNRITKIRQASNLDMGLIVPKIRIQDNMTLEPNEYSFKIHGIEAGRATIKLGYYMAINTGRVLQELQGERTKDPTFGMDALWISEDKRQEAEDAGYAVVDPPTIIATHLTEIIRANAAEILGRQEVKAIIDEAEKTNPIVVKEVLETAKMSYGQIEKVLKNLLEERVSIRNIVPILETISNYAPVTTNVWDLTAKVRETLGKQIAMQYADENKKIRLMVLSQSLAEMIMDHAVYPKDGSKPMVALDPVDRRLWMKCMTDALQQAQGNLPIILCSSAVRQLVHSSIEREFPGVVVLSETELYAAGNKIQIEVIGEISEANTSEEIA